MKRILHAILLTTAVLALSFGFSQAASAAGTTPGKVTLVSVKTESAKSITVNWKKTSGAEGYQIFRKGTKGAFKKIASVADPKATSFTDKKLKPGKIYTYTVKAYSGKKTGAFDTKGKRAATAVTISPSSKPVRITEPYNFNKATKTYWAIQSYLDYYRGLDSFMLILKKGTYNIPGTIWVPSGAQIVLSKGVKINKTANSGGAYVGFPGRLFIFLDHALAQKKNAVKGYNGTQNASVTADGTAVINMPAANGIVFTTAHSNNIKFSGLTISLTGKNQKAFQLLSTANVQIEKCTIAGSGKDDRGVMIDLAAAGALQDYTFAKRDNAVCKNITVSGCKFKKMQNAIVSPRFIKNKYHTNITVQNCKISNTKEDAIRVYNWNAFSILNNTFDTIAEGAVCKSGPTVAIRINGGWAPVIKGNTFTNLPRAISATVNKNGDPKLAGQGKPKNKISAGAWKIIENQNHPGKLGDYYASEVKGADSVRHWFADSRRTYYMTPNDKPYRNQNILLPDYTKNKSKTEWRQHFAFRSYLEQIERNGGGTLILKPGTYYIVRRLHIPSNTTIKFMDGVILTETASKLTTDPGPIFEMLNKADSGGKVQYKGYGGVHDVTIEGPEQGKAYMCKNFHTGSAITIAHTKNITVRNIIFKDMQGDAHFIELDASAGTLIENCVFDGSSFHDKNKGAINIDIPDKNTGGFNSTYTSYDCTADYNVIIRNNRFKDVPVAIESHKYNPAHPHRNINVSYNVIESYHFGIRAQNWVDSVIRGNKIILLEDAEDEYGIRLDGAQNPTVSENTVYVHASANDMNLNGYFMRIADASYKGAAPNYADVRTKVNAENQNSFRMRNQLFFMEGKDAYQGDCRIRFILTDSERYWWNTSQPISEWEPFYYPDSDQQQPVIPINNENQ